MNTSTNIKYDVTSGSSEYIFRMKDAVQTNVFKVETSDYIFVMWLLTHTLLNLDNYDYLRPIKKSNAL